MCLMTVQVRERTGQLPVHKNMPAVTGALRWAHELRQRLTTNMDNFKQIEHPAMESKEAQDVHEHHDKMIQLLSQ